MSNKLDNKLQRGILSLAVLCFCPAFIDWRVFFHHVKQVIAEITSRSSVFICCNVSHFRFLFAWKVKCTWEELQLDHSRSLLWSSWNHNHPTFPLCFGVMWWLTPAMVRPMAKNAPFWSRQTSEPYAGRPQSLPDALWVNWRDSFPQPLLTKEALRALTGLCWLSQLVSPLAHFAGWSATGRLIHGPPSFRLLTTDLSELFTRSPPPLPRLTQLFPKILPTFLQAALAALFSPMLEWKRLTRDWNIHKYLVITYANTQVVSVSQTVKTFTGESLKKGCTFMQSLSCKYSSWHLNCWLFSVNFCKWNKSWIQTMTPILENQGEDSIYPVGCDDRVF